jgi:hypothetical protein
MTLRTKNADDPKVKAWNEIEREIRRVRDDRVVAVRYNDVAQREYCDKRIKVLKADQVAVFTTPSALSR